jgi:hypothetical protein
MSSGIKNIELNCRDLVAIRSELTQIRAVDGRRNFTSEELARARTFLLDEGVISKEVKSVTASSLMRFMSHLDFMRSKIPGDCDSFTKSVKITIEESSRTFVMADFAFMESEYGTRELTADELDIIGVITASVGVDDLFVSGGPHESTQAADATSSRVIPSAIVLNEEFPSEREDWMWGMVGRAYDALERAQRMMEEGKTAALNKSLSEALGVISEMGVTAEFLDSLWEKHPGLALDVRKLSIGAANLLHAMGEEGRAFDLLAGNVTVPYGAAALVYDYSFAGGFGYPSPTQTSPECSYDHDARSWAENTYRKLTRQLEGKINCFEAVKAKDE